MLGTPSPNTISASGAERSAMKSTIIRSLTSPLSLVTSAISVFGPSEIEGILATQSDSVGLSTVLGILKTDANIGSKWLSKFLVNRPVLRSNRFDSLPN